MFSIWLVEQTLPWFNIIRLSSMRIIILPSLRGMPQSLRVTELHYWSILHIKTLPADHKSKICLLSGDKNKQPIQAYCLFDFSFVFLLFREAHWFLFPLSNYLHQETMSHRIPLRVFDLFTWLENHFADLKKKVRMLSNHMGLKYKIYLEGKMPVIA